MLAPQRQRNAWLAPLLALLVVAAAGALGFVLYLTLRDDSGNTAGDSERSDPSSPTQPSEPDELICWDADSPGPASACTEPTGTAGLRWVFPSFDPEECVRTRGRDLAEGADETWECSSWGAEGRVRVRYTRWSTTDAARSIYFKRYSDPPLLEPDQAEPEFQTWRGIGNPEPTFDLTRLYADHPFSVSVVAEYEADRESAFTGLEFRPAAELRGVPG